MHYYLTGIQLAEDVTLNGTGWTNPTGVLTLLAPKMEVDEYESYGYDEAVADEGGNYVDLMDAAAASSLDLVAERRGDADAGYNYLIVNWAQPVKVRATAYAADGETVAMVTRAGERNETTTGDNGYVSHATHTPAALTEPVPSELATVRLNNGGSIVRLARPVKVGEESVLHLVFDPLQSVRASVGDASTQATLQDGLGNGFDVGLVGLTPVLARPDDVVMRERYRVRLNESTLARHGGDTTKATGYDLVAQVFYLERTPGEVAAVSFGTLSVDGDGLLPAGAPTQPFMIFYMEQAGESWSFLSYDRAPLVSSFVRGESGGTCAVGCLYQVCGSEMVSNGEAGADMATMDVDYEFIDRAAVRLPGASAVPSATSAG
jgi:hypothetical protein